MVLDASLLNKVGIKGKVKISMERSSILPDTLVANEKGTLRSPLTMITNLCHQKKIWSEE